jgi:hypothetical protein
MGGSFAFGGNSSIGGTSATTGTSACRALLTLCDGTCVITGTAHDHCGACDNACGATEICLGGVCRCPANNSNADAGPVTKYESCTEGQCVDLQSSITNCGACNNGCAPKRCIQGTCGCASTDMLCNGPVECAVTDSSCIANATCVDPLTSKDHCGSCGTQCGPYQECVQGACVLNCAASNLTECDGKCVDTQNNSATGTSGVVENCGGCGISCPTSRFQCKSGACVCSAAAVLATVAHCTDPTLGDLCVDTATDPRFCGNCQTACASGRVCQNSQCVCSSTATQCGSICYDVTSDSNHCGDCNTVCGVGEHCSSGTCVCTAPLASCAGRCADYLTEAANCGGCGNACGKGQSCTAGKCPCSTGMDLCGGSCFDFQTDASHCGNCTTACASSQICKAGNCACDNGLTACGQSCVDAQNDATNCGVCGKTCAATQMCQGGACVASILKVQSAGQADSQQTLSLNISVCNASGSSLSLNGVSLKYWYTEDGAAVEQVASVDYVAGLSPAPTASATLLDLSAYRDKASSVLQVTFGSNTLAANACTGAVQISVHPQDYVGTYAAQSGDYSYSAATTLTDNPNITAYDSKGMLIWGVEPVPAAMAAVCPGTSCTLSLSAANNIKRSLG